MDDLQNKKIKIKFLQSAQSRIILAAVLVAVAVGGVALFVHWRNKVAARQSFASVSGGPRINSIPGAGSPSSEYVQAQTQANISGEEKARKSGTAFIPTITRTGFVGDLSQFGQGVTDGEKASASDSNQCNTTKVVTMFRPNPENCTAQKLSIARQTGVTAEELLCQGCSCPALKLAGYNAGDLKRIGMSVEQLKACGFDLQALVDAGFTASDLKQAGFSAAQLKNAGFTPGELKSAGFSTADLKQAGFTAAQLSRVEFASAGGECDPAELAKERSAGASAASLKAKGCDLAALKAAGFTAAQLKNAGFSATALKGVGFSNSDLSAAGFSASEIKAADQSAGNCSVEQLKRDRAAGMSATALRNRGCGLSALKAAGFSAGALRQAGFSAAQLKGIGFSAKDLRDAGFSAAALKKAGFSAAALKNAGYSASALKSAGFSAAQLKNAGFSATALKDAGYSPSDLKNAGFSAAQLKDAGFSASDLKSVGFSAGELRSAGFSPKQLLNAGYSASALHRAGVTADELRDAGVSAAELKRAGYTKGDLLRSGFSPKDAGYATVSQPTQTPPVQNDLSQVESDQKMVPGASLLSINANSPEARLARFEKQQREEMTQQARSDRINTMSGYMTGMSQKLLTGWSSVATQKLTKAQEVEKTESASEGQSGFSSVLGKSKSTSDSAGKSGPIIKAGTVLFAVLDTSIDSDENTPVMGRIVSGPLNGSKLLGTFTRQDKRLLIRFNMLNSRYYAKSITINAVAIDPDTARTAISGEVNNHYLLRYGTLFASSFLEGFSQGIMNQGVSSDCLFGGFGCTLQQKPLDPIQQVAVGLGKVGNAYAQHMGQNFTVPPTVKIGAGTGIGVLLMTDLTLPAQTIQASNQAMGVNQNQF